MEPTPPAAKAAEGGLIVVPAAPLLALLAVDLWEVPTPAPADASTMTEDAHPPPALAPKPKPAPLAPRPGAPDALLVLVPWPPMSLMSTQAAASVPAPCLTLPGGPVNPSTLATGAA